MLGKTLVYLVAFSGYQKLMLKLLLFTCIYVSFINIHTKVTVKCKLKSLYNQSSIMMSPQQLQQPLGEIRRRTKKELFSSSFDQDCMIEYCKI